MKKKSVHKNAMILLLSISILSPHIPLMANAAGNSKAADTSIGDLFPVTDSDGKADAGLGVTNPNVRIGGANQQQQGNKKTPVAGSPSGSSSGSSSSGGSSTMKPVTLPGDLSCPLFENRPHAELISAIDALSKEIKTTSECTDDPSVKSLNDNGKVIKENVSALQKIIDTEDPTQINTAQIDQSTTLALQALANMGDVLNNSSFLNSKCGRQTMSTGKVLLALNDVISGLAPYALFAVSMNAALAPALPFVVGGAIATSGISAVAKMVDSRTLDMTNPDHRKAVLQNTCEFTRVAKKVRFMQLAQSGKIEAITQEMDRDLAKYRNFTATPSGELASLLRYKSTATKGISQLETQLTSDRTDLITIENQITSNGDDLLMCTISQEMMTWTKDGKSFPASVFKNLTATVSQGNKSQQLQAAMMNALNTTSIKRLNDLSGKINKDDKSLKACGDAGRSWLAGIRQAITTTANIINQNKNALENELEQSSDYRNWKAQYRKVQIQQVTVKRVTKAMEELARDNSIIDRSELAQRMVLLKEGLFGSRSSWSLGKPPVLAWIEYTRSMHQRAISDFLTDLANLKSGAWTLTATGQGKSVTVNRNGSIYQDAKKQVEDAKSAKTLASLNLTELPLGSPENELACQQLESAWLDWSAAIDHLGAIQFFCNMIDPVLDKKMDATLVSTCRSDLQLNGQVLTDSVVNQAKKILVSKGYQNDANIVSQKMKELQCPVPSVSVMN